MSLLQHEPCLRLLPSPGHSLSFCRRRILGLMGARLEDGCSGKPTPNARDATQSFHSTARGSRAPSLESKRCPLNRGLLAGGESPQARQGPGGGPRDPEEARTRQPHAWTLALLVGSLDSAAARVGAPGPRDSGVVAAPSAFPPPRTPGLPAAARALHPDPSSAPREPLQRHLQAERAPRFGPRREQGAERAEGERGEVGSAAPSAPRSPAASWRRPASSGLASA